MQAGSGATKAVGGRFAHTVAEWSKDEKFLEKVNPLACSAAACTNTLIVAAFCNADLALITGTDDVSEQLQPLGGTRARSRRDPNERENKVRTMMK